MPIHGAVLPLVLVFLLVPAFAAAYVRSSDAYIGTPVACSEEEKFCFRYNLLYNAEHGKCAPMFSHCSNDEVSLVVNKEELTGPEPKLKAKCGGARCPRHLESYFWPRGECLDPASADVKCVGSSRTLNMFGEWECWCADGTNATNATDGSSASPCPTPVARPQPPEASRCLVPDLFEPYARQYSIPAAAGPCTDEEFRCYNRSQVLFQGQCLAPLGRGPCAEGEWLVLTRVPALTAACAPRRCPDDHHVWLDTPDLKVQRQCQPKEVVRKLLCQDREEILIDAFGYGKCNEKGSTPPFELPNVRENGVCSVTSTRPHPVTPGPADQQPVSSEAAPTVPPVLIQSPTVPSPSTPPQVVGNADASTPSPIVVIPVAPTPSPVVVIPEASTPFPVAVSPEISTPSPIVVIPEASTPSSEAKSPSGGTEVPQQLLVDPQPCVNPPCPISPAVLPQLNTSQALSPEVVAVPAVLGRIEISTPPGEKITTGEVAQVNQQQLIVSQLDSSPSVSAPVDLSIPSQPSSVIVQTPFTELVAPDVSTSEQQLTIGEPVASTAVSELAGPSTFENQSNSETAPPVQVPEILAVSNPSEQNISFLGNPDITQQLVEQPRVVPPAVPNLQLVTDAIIRPLPPISVEPGVTAVAEQNPLIAEGTPESLPNAPVLSQLLEQGQSHVFGGSIQPQPASFPVTPVQSTNVGPAISVPPENVVTSLIQQQHVNGNVPPSSVPIVQNDPSVTSLHFTNGSPVISVQPGNGNIPLVSLQPDQNIFSSGLVQGTQGQVPIGPVQTRRGDVVVDYVLLGQSNVPVNSV